MDDDSARVPDHIAQRVQRRSDIVDDDDSGKLRQQRLRAGVECRAAELMDERVESGCTATHFRNVEHREASGHLVQRRRVLRRDQLDVEMAGEQRQHRRGVFGGDLALRRQRREQRDARSRRRRAEPRRGEDRGGGLAPRRFLHRLERGAGHVVPGELARAQQVGGGELVAALRGIQQVAQHPRQAGVLGRVEEDIAATDDLRQARRIRRR